MLGRLFVAVFSLYLIFLGLGSFPLMEPDEGRNAEVAREIVVDGHWFPPTLGGRVRYEKPPLFYWLEAFSFKLWGLNEFAARFVPAFSAFLTVVCVWFMGRLLWQEEVGIYAALALSSMFIFFMFSRIVIFDMLLTFFIAASLVFFVVYLDRKSHFYSFLSGLLASFAFLTKGPVGVVIPLMGILPVIFHRREDVVRFFVFFFLPFLFVVFPVFAFLEVKSPGYCYNFFWKENVLRYLTPVFKREKPWWFFIAVLFVGLMPWSLFAGRIRESLGILWAEEREKFYMLAGWAVLPVLFFSFSKSKMPQYILPAFPAWALIVGHSLSDFGFVFEDALRKLLFVVLLCYTCFVFVMPFYAKNRSFHDVRYEGIDRTRPLVFFKAKAYTLSFYLNRTPVLASSELTLKRLLKKKKCLYVFTRKSKLDDVKKGVSSNVRVVWRKKGYLLLNLCD